MSSHHFSARVTLDCEGVAEIEVWVHELNPLDLKRRSIAEWVEEHLHECKRSVFADMLPKGENTNGNIQILFTGVMQSSFDDYTREYDEDFYPNKVEFQHLPDDWFEREATPNYPPMVQLEIGAQ